MDFNNCCRHCRNCSHHSIFFSLNLALYRIISVERQLLTLMNFHLYSTLLYTTLLFTSHLFSSLHFSTAGSFGQINAPWVFNALWYFIKVNVSPPIFLPFYTIPSYPIPLFNSKYRLVNTSCSVLSYLILFYLVLSWLVLPCLVLSCCHFCVVRRWLVYQFFLSLFGVM